MTNSKKYLLKQEQKKNNSTILLHACCGICSSYPVSYLQDAGYDVCSHFGVWLIEENYNPEEFFDYVKGFENEPEKGLRCDKCFELRLQKTAEKAKELAITDFTTSIVISPHKNFQKLAKIGTEIAEKENLNFLAVDFKKKDGFLKTNKIANSLSLYRQNYCGCKFSMR